MKIVFYVVVVKIKGIVVMVSIIMSMRDFLGIVICVKVILRKFLLGIVISDVSKVIVSELLNSLVMCGEKNRSNK